MRTSIRKNIFKFIKGVKIIWKKKIKELEQEYFYLKMQDHWDSSDYRYANELREEIKRCKDAIKQKIPTT